MQPIQIMVNGDLYSKFMKTFKRGFADFMPAGDLSDNAVCQARQSANQAALVDAGAAIQEVVHKTMEARVAKDEKKRAEEKSAKAAAKEGIEPAPVYKPAPKTEAKPPPSSVMATTNLTKPKAAPKAAPKKKAAGKKKAAKKKSRR